LRENRKKPNTSSLSTSVWTVGFDQAH